MKRLVCYTLRAHIRMDRSYELVVTHYNGEEVEGAQKRRSDGQPLHTAPNELGGQVWVVASSYVDQHTSLLLIGKPAGGQDDSMP